MPKKIWKNKYVFAGLCLIILATFTTAHALTADELQQLINQKEAQKQQLEAENQKLTQQINQTQAQAQTLQTTLSIIKQNAQKLSSDIKITQNNISSAQYQIDKLGLAIGDATMKMGNAKLALIQSIQNLAENDTTSVIEAFLNDQSLVDLWNDAENLKKLETGLQDNAKNLAVAKTNYQSQQDQIQSKKNDLQSYKSDLSSQQQVVLENQKTQATLLAQTKNQESQYQAMLQRNIELGKQIESEQFEYESQLKTIVDPTTFPAPRHGILYWPLDFVYITQKFGATVDSKRLYLSGTHDGVDFRAAVGTPVKAILDGVVEATGNTDDERGCYSYGRWALIRHPNGLSSIYAHLSALKVSKGDAVATGQIIGFSGGMPGMSGAGYSLGPHLHLGLYATDAVQVAQFVNSIHCKQVFIPLAPPNGYLDPLAYLPAYNGN